MFISWYGTTSNYVILLYFISMAMILFNLVTTSIIVSINLIDRPEKLREFTGGSMDLSAGKYAFPALVHKVSSVLSFVSIWLTTTLLMYSSKDALTRQTRKLIMPTVLLVYFFISYFSQDIFNSMLNSYLRTDPILLSIIVIMIFTLIKPVGGIMFGIAFWNISRSVSYEKTLKDYMIISGYGFLLLFSANQSTSLVLGPYPPFGVSTITILITATYLIMIGIYKSATLISTNIELRKTIHKFTRESKLLDLIGNAEMEKELNITVNKILKQTAASQESQNISYELDEGQLKNYVGKVINELRKEKPN
ncbi:MAG: hypothetical protein ACHQ1D_03880 [Nitrososphaerales archaeon]